jgi:glycosyltransferase involved in cell wall biosynthesis
VADLGLVPYENTCLNQYYCTPNKLFDFISVGIPIVASDLPELRKVVDTYQIGRLLSSLEPAVIAKAVNELIDHPETYETCKRNMEQAQAAFNWKNEAEKLIRFYGTL